MVFLVSTDEELGFRWSDMVFNIVENDILVINLWMRNICTFLLIVKEAG